MESVISELIRVWMNERNAPELLRFAKDVVDDVLEILEFQEEEVQRPTTGEASFLNMLKSAEMERVKYMLANYLKTRIGKIEEFAIHYKQKREMSAQIMSAAELAYLEKYYGLMKSAIYEAAMKHMPEKLRDIEETTPVDMVERPDANAPVFARIREDIGEVRLGDEIELVSLARGQIYLLRYEAISELLQADRVELV